MRWVTWENIGVDRMACGWLIRRFIDPKAVFQFIPAGTKPRGGGARSFDIPGVPYSHHRGHCSFHAMIRAYKLKDPILRRIARIVDEADVVQEVAVEPVAPGLDFICRGIRRTSPGDLTAMDRGRMIYDALYEELKLQMESQHRGKFP
ncbi:MAG: chromate resistance protein [Planctomycetes bacterium]|nr:chromate resistance protein [Planctomycetota bacterium]